MVATEPEHLWVADQIPTLVWRGVGNDPRPAIISNHGLGGCKEDRDPEIVARLTAGGITLVTFDAYLHGEHRPPGRTAPERYTVATILAVLPHTVMDLSTLVAYLQQDAAIDDERIGLRGGSMGGYIALAAVGQDLPVCAILSVCGGADYPKSFGPHVRGETSWLTPEEVAQAREHWEEVRPLDPLLHVDRFPPRPILMIHGARDPLVPMAGHRALYDALVPQYRDRPNDCIFITHAGEHGTPLPLERFGWEWLMSRLTGHDEPCE